MDSSAVLQILEAWKNASREMTMLWTATREKMPPFEFLLHGYISDVDASGIRVFVPDPKATGEMPLPEIGRAFVSLEGALPEGPLNPRHVRFNLVDGGLLDLILV